MIVDPHKELGDYVRAAMELLNRPSILLEMPSTKSALDEMSNSSINLVVTTYKTDGTMNGLEFGTKCLHKQAGTPVIILAERDDPGSSELELEQSPFQYLDFPPAEKFFQSIRIGLDGADVVQAEQGTAALDLGPIPALEIDKAQSILNATIRDLGAVGGLISDRSGRIVTEGGATGYVDKAKLSALLGPSFAMTTKTAPELGGHSPLLQYFDGERYDLYALSIGYHYFLMFIFDGTKRAAFGAVTRFGREGAERITELLGDEAWSYKATVEAKALPIADLPAKEQRKQKAESAPARVKEEPTPPPPEPFKEDEPILEPVKDLDLDRIFGEESVNDNSFDDLFSEDELSNLSSLPGDKVSFEEAQDMGLLGE
jgi:hypothetical protein